MKKAILKKLNWKIVTSIAVFLVLFVYWIYSFLGVTFGPINQKENGNYCKGYTYGIKICWGDINAE